MPREVPELDVEGYTEGAVEALRRAGYNAWKNAVSDIGVTPLDDFFSIL